MSKNNGPDQAKWPPGYVIEDSSVSYLEGRLLTIIESLGLNPNQEKAVKDLVRNEAWQVLNHASYITAEQHTQIQKENAKMNQTIVR